MYGDGGLYHPLEYGFIVGALLPVPAYFLSKRFPNSGVRYVHVPLILYGALGWAPYNLTYVWPALVVGAFFNYYVKRRFSLWWQKYAYVLTSSFSTGVGISAIVIFFAVQYKAVNFHWWGNTVSNSGCDASQCPLLKVPASGHF